MFKVTNRNPFDFVAKHAGISYFFPQGKTVAMPDEAAAHIFAIGDPDKTTVLMRHGWVRPTESLKGGLAILDNFAFERVVPKIDVPFASDIDAEQELDDHGAAPVVQEPEARGKGTDGSAPRASGVQAMPPKIDMRERLLGGRAAA
jgi:hypothetical protein